MAVDAKKRQTKQGPSDWKTVRCRSIARLTAGGTPSTRHLEYWGGDIPWMSSGELNLKRVFDVDGRITDTGLSNSAAKMIPKHSVLIGLAGQGKTRGTAAINEIDLCTNQSVAAIIPDSKKVDYLYLFYNIDSRYNELRRLSTGDGGRGGLNLQLLGSLQIQLPPLPEQEKIAEILSTWDEAITKVSKLIEAKRTLKKGLMQQLLTGKRRFPGFTKPWKKIRIEECCENLDNQRIPLSSDERRVIKGVYPYYGANGLLDWINDYIFDDDLILLAEDGGHFDEFTNRSIAYRVTGKCWVNNHAHILKARRGFNQDFIFYNLEHKDIRRFLNGGTRSKLNKSELLGIPIMMPDRDEQDKIATVFNIVDAEVRLALDWNNYIRNQKRGLMQKLLTGKVRVKV